MLKAILLENCPYSNAMREMFENYNIKTKYIVVNQQTKHKYKTSEIDTFPQLYYDKYLIGGYNDTEEIINYIINSNNVNDILRFLSNKYPNYDKKTLLRISISLHSKSLDI
jgi:glutaredoxin